MEQTPVFENDTGRLSGDLDRLEVKVGKVGMNSAETARSILAEMDSVYERIQAMEVESSRKQAAAQFAGIAGKLRHDAAPFLRDLGGPAALQKARAQENPPEDHWWWYLDAYLAGKRQAALKRSLITLGAVALALVILGVVYNRFLAPDPRTAALYAREQSARDALINGDLNQALDEINAGLVAVPNDPTLIMMRGVVKERQGDQPGALVDFVNAEKAFGSKESFLLARGQAYAQANLNNEALADALQVIQIDPKSAEAYLIAGNAYESLKRYREALDMYNTGFDVANASGQTELAAMAKMRQAMVMQVIGVQPEPTGSPTP